MTSHQERKLKFEGTATTNELAKSGIIRTRIAQGYVRLKYPKGHRYTALLERHPFFPGWDKEAGYTTTKRVFMTAKLAQDYGMMVYFRYLRLSQLYWATLYSGPLGRLRKLKAKFKAYLAKRIAEILSSIGEQ